MKKMLLALSALLLTTSAPAQFLFSHLDNWAGTDEQCGSTPHGVCQTFSQLWVPSIGTGAEWFKIGTPHRPTEPSSLLVFVTPDLVNAEGIFTDFNFSPTKRYKIRIGIEASESNGKLAFYATDGLVQSAYYCCQEPFLDDGAGGANGYYEKNGPGSLPGDTPRVEYIANITPGYIPGAGPQIEKILYYTPTTNFSQFAVHCKKIATYPPVPHYEVTIDYIAIEEVCDVDFSYTLNTSNMLDVGFDGEISNTSGIYADWDMGDGNTASATDHTHSYASHGDYKVCLKSKYTEMEDWGCEECKDVCVNQPEYMAGQGLDPNWDIVPAYDPALCTNSDFELWLNAPGNDVILSPLGHAEPYYVIDWGDGTISPHAGTVASWPHNYSGGSPGSSISYKVCLETGTNCKTCVDICVFTPWPDENEYRDDRDLPEGEDRLYQASGSAADPDLLLESIAPNPANTETTLIVSSNEERAATAIVTDLTGKVVLRISHQLGIGKNYVTLPVANLENGMYLVELAADGKSIKGKFAKQ